MSHHTAVRTRRPSYRLTRRGEIVLALVQFVFLLAVIAVALALATYVAAQYLLQIPGMK